MQRSASERSSSPDEPSAGKKEEPTLTDTIISGHAERLASSTARDNRFCISATLSLVTSGRTNTNSSPPRRPTWSYSRQEDLNLAAISWSSLFPVRCPKVSFTFLKPLRSHSSTASAVLARRTRDSSFSRCRQIDLALGRPVRKSVLAVLCASSYWRAFSTETPSLELAARSMRRCSLVK